MLVILSLIVAASCQSQGDCDAGFSCVNNVCTNLGPAFSTAPSKPLKPRKAPRIPYHEGDAIPDGASVIETRHKPLWVTGTVLLSVSWAITAFTTAYLCSEGCPRFAVPMGFVPVLGPVVNAAVSEPGAMAFMISMALVQAGSAALLFAGIFTTRQFIVMPTGVAGTF